MFLLIKIRNLFINIDLYFRIYNKFVKNCKIFIIYYIVIIKFYRSHIGSKYRRANILLCIALYIMAMRIIPLETETEIEDKSQSLISNDNSNMVSISQIHTKKFLPLEIKIEKKPQFFMINSHPHKVDLSYTQTKKFLPLETEIEDKSQSSIHNQIPHKVDLSYANEKNSTIRNKIKNKSQFLTFNYDPLMIPPKKTVTFWNPFFSGIFYLPSPPGLSLATRRVTF